MKGKYWHCHNYFTPPTYHTPILTHLWIYCSFGPYLALLDPYNSIWCKDIIIGPFRQVWLSFGNASIFPWFASATLPKDGHVQSKVDAFVQVGGSMGLWLGLSVVQAMMLLARFVPTCGQTLMARLWLNFWRYCKINIFDLSVPKPSILWCNIDDDLKKIISPDAVPTT